MRRVKYNFEVAEALRPDLQGVGQQYKTIVAAGRVREPRKGRIRVCLFDRNSIAVTKVRECARMFKVFAKSPKCS